MLFVGIKSYFLYCHVFVKRSYGNLERKNRETEIALDF